MILLDTHALIWAVADPERLSTSAYQAIEQARKRDGLGIAAISLWEVATLIGRGRGRIHVYGMLEASLRLLTEGVTVKPLTIEIATLAAQFPGDYPRDLADRLIGATARAEGLLLVTRDEKIRRSGLVQTIW